MNSKFQKINRGVVLLVVLVVLCVFYLVVQAISLTADQKAIQNICYSTISTLEGFSVLPEEVRFHSESYSDESLEDYTHRFTQAMQDYEEKDDIENTLEVTAAHIISAQNEDFFYLTQYRMVKGSEDFYCDIQGNTATVKWYAEINTRWSLPGSSANSSSTAYTEYTFTLQKIDGDWKLIGFDPDFSIDYLFSGYYGGY